MDISKVIKDFVSNMPQIEIPKFEVPKISTPPIPQIQVEDKEYQVDYGKINENLDKLQSYSPIPELISSINSIETNQEQFAKSVVDYFQSLNSAMEKESIKTKRQFRATLIVAIIAIIVAILQIFL